MTLARTKESIISKSPREKHTKTGAPRNMGAGLFPAVDFYAAERRGGQRLAA